MARGKRKNLPLAGVKVVELSTFVASPNAARLLADWGADVIKVEALTGDPFRRVGKNHHCAATDEENPFFTQHNANKRFIAIDLKTAAGMTAMLRLIESADIFMTNIRMKSLVKMGLDYRSIIDRYPDKVYGHFTGYGDRGREASKPGFDGVAFWARSGAARDWGDKEGFPFVAPTGAGDAMAGALFASGILAAYIGAKATGQGTLVSNSLLGSAVWFNAAQVIATQFGSVLPMDKNRPNNPMGYPYECKDGEWLVLGAGDYPRDFPRVCRAVGLSCLANNEKFNTIEAMHENIDDFLPLIRNAFKKKDRDEWVDIFDSLDMVCGKIGHISELATDEQALANRYIVPVTYDSGNTIAMPAVPVTFEAYEEFAYDPSGEIGRDTEEILEEIGYTENEIAGIRMANAIK